MRRLHTLAFLVLFALGLTMGGRAAQAATIRPQVETHTIQEIRAFAQRNGVTRSESTFKKEPVLTAPYDPGELSDETTQEALAMLNFMRYLAGLDANVMVDETYQKQAQAAALVNAVNDELSHVPEQPEDMSYALYNLGAAGASHSNIACGYHSVADSIVNGYMDDSDPDNIENVGHRRWLLNPALLKTGFGQVDDYSATYVIDRGNLAADQDLVVWPAQKTPVQVFDRFIAWSVMTSKTVNPADVEIRISRRGTDETWTITENGGDGHMYLGDGIGCELDTCLIFLPGGMLTVEDGEIYDVTIQGIGADTLSYSVEFFDMGDLWWKPADITLTAEGTGLSEITAPEVTLHYDWAGTEATGCYLRWSSPDCVDLSFPRDGEATVSLSGEPESQTATITVRAYDWRANEYVAKASVNLNVYQLTWVPYQFEPVDSLSGVTLSWQEPMDFDDTYQYEVLRKTGSGSFMPIGRTTDLSYVDRTAQYGTTYTYTIRCLSADGTHVTSYHDQTGRTITHTKTGWEKVGSFWYYWNNGVKQTGWVQVSGKWYYMNSSGVMATGWQKISGKWYYLNASGVMATGWTAVSGKWYYMNSSGTMQTGWVKVSGKWYYMNSSGVMQTGWQQISEKWYYFNAAGAMQVGFLKLSGKWYYMSSSGAMTTGWAKIGKNWYHFAASGVMETGWQQISEKWYYFKDTGVMQTGFVTLSGKTYYLNASGAMEKGWVQDNGKWYHMNSSGVMETGWQQLSGKWYYFGEDGAMYRANTYYIDGKYYKFDSNGVWVG